jgi:A/G-specific adenine glycosylase
MDLGALVCRPRGPRCTACPLAGLCRGRSAVRTGGKRRARPTPLVREVAIVARKGARLFMRQRATGGLWSGLWEFPTVGPAGDLDSALQTLGISRTGSPRRLTAVVHQLTHRRYEFRPVLVAAADLRRARPQAAGLWTTPQDRRALAISTAHRRILAVVESSP